MLKWFEKLWYLIRQVTSPIIKSIKLRVLYKVSKHTQMNNWTSVLTGHDFFPLAVFVDMFRSNSLTMLTIYISYCVLDGIHTRFPTEFSAEGVLITNLLAGYEKRGGKYARPVINHTHAVPVEFMLQLIQIVDLDEKNQVLKLNLWTNYVSIQIYPEQYIVMNIYYNSHRSVRRDLQTEFFHEEWRMIVFNQFTPVWSQRRVVQANVFLVRFWQNILYRPDIQSDSFTKNII